MRKKILFAGLFLVAITTVTFYSHSKKKGLGNLMLENIEALASGEWESGAICLGSGSVDCPINHVKVEYVMSGYSLEDFNQGCKDEPILNLE